jgi:DNA repair exonuclease SbcCD ATPase subunit
MQATDQEAPLPPPDPLPQTTIKVPGPDGKQLTLLVPQTQDAIDALRARRQELSNQLTSATDRRNTLAQEIKTASEGQSRTGLEARMQVLDQRIVQLESDIATTGRLLSSAPAELQASEEINPNPGGDDFPEGLVVGGGGVLFVFALLALYRRIRHGRWRARRATAPALSNESAERLARVENAVEAIAIEVERISEGQRFVTKLLAENHAEPSTVPIGKS